METPRPFSLLCELTYRCPLQCPYCSNPLDFARHKTELDTEEWRRVLTQAAALGVVQANFSGGEPLLRADAPEIIRHAHGLGLYTNLSTGGTLLTEKLARELRAAGLDSLQVSILDADAENSDRMAGGARAGGTRGARRARRERAAQGAHGNPLCAAGLFRAISESLPARLGAGFSDRGRRWRGAAVPDGARDSRVEIRQRARAFAGKHLVRVGNVMQISRD